MKSKKISNDQERLQSDPTSCPQNQKADKMYKEMYKKVCLLHEFILFSCIFHVIDRQTDHKQLLFQVSS